MNKFNKYHLSDNAAIHTSEVPGPESRKLLEQQARVEGNIVSYPKRMPMAIKKAKGAIIEDVDGNQFIDFFAGCGVLNVGHCNEDVLARVREQQENLIHALDFPTANKLELINRILDQLPEEQRNDFKVSFCGPTGSDAIEAAIKLAKHYTGRDGIIVFQGSYHGMTSGALAVTSNTGFRSRVNSLIPHVHFVPYSYCYRCPFNKSKNDCRLDCAEYLKNILENPHSGIAKPAAILIEPIQGEGGTIVPKDGYLKRITDIAREHGVVVIFDEVQSGFFRTGTFWECQHAGVLPDIITMSKGLGGIGFPISAIIYNKRIEAWSTADHIGTFRGNQVSISAGNAAFAFIEEHEVAEHVTEMGNYLMEKLKYMMADHPFIGEVRGRGLFIGIEYVKNKESKEPFPGFVSALGKACFKKGLLFEIGGHYGNVIRFVPPLIINKEIADNAMKIFEAVNTALVNEYSAQLSIAL
jgi:diaminobutyrate-2-oxoglutarate transaminase